MKSASATHVGHVRQENEDFLIAKDNVFIVADGMGGHSAGDIASKLTAQTVYKVITEDTGKDTLQKIKKAIETANKKVIEKALQIEAKNGMGTTLTLVVIEGSTAFVGHIGDSRAYLLRGAKLKQITEDHSMVEEMVKQGKITKKEASEHPYRNVITKAVGSDTKIAPDLFSFELSEGDRLLLTSDGLTSMIKDSAIKKIISEGKLKESCDKLIAAANAKGGADNTTVILVDFLGAKKKKPAGNNKNSSMKGKIIAAVVTILLVLALITGGYFLNNNSYYLGNRSGKVTLFKGLPFKLLGYKFSKVAYVSDVAYKDLDPAIKKRLAKKITVQNRNDGIEAINDMKDELNQ